jgi:hypothetical protein
VFAFFVRFKAAKAKRLGERGAALFEFGLLAPQADRGRLIDASIIKIPPRSPFCR